MKLKKRFMISNLIMLIAPVLLIGVISVLVFLGFFTKYSLENFGVHRAYSNMTIAANFIHFIKTNPTAIRYIILYIFLCIFVIAVVNTIITKRLSNSISSPIKELTNASEKIKNGDLNFSVLGSEYEEIDNLCQMFDIMRMELKESREKEAEMTKERSMLLANLSHDLKTPITSIKGYVEGIRDGVADTPEKMEKYLNTIYAKAILIDDMVNNLSMFSKLELSRLEFKFVLGDFNNFIRETAEEYRLDFQKNGIRLDLKIPDTKAMVKIDFEKMHRVFSNLFDNCIKYKGDGDGSVQVRTVLKDGGIFATVADSGIGIDEDKLNAVFDSFYRVDTARTLNIKGSGLGLGIAKQIVEKHGGKIWLKSGDGKGTTAIVYLPVIEIKQREGSANG